MMTSTAVTTTNVPRLGWLNPTIVLCFGTIILLIVFVIIVEYQFNHQYKQMRRLRQSFIRDISRVTSDFPENIPPPLQPQQRTFQRSPKNI